MSRISTKSWFDRWSNEYDRTLGSIGFHRALLDLVVKNSGVRSGDSVLDIGCGTGLLSLKFLEAQDCVITAIDNSENMMAIFKDKIRRLGIGGNVTVRTMDAARLTFGEKSFDRAVSSVVLHHLKEKVRPLRGIYKVLKPGGMLIIGEVDMDSTGSHRDSGRLERMLKPLTEEWVAALDDAGLEAFTKMYENGIKHILNRGEYCLSLEQWAGVCRKAGFSRVTVKRVPHYKYFGIVAAEKTTGKA
ncbi:MAG: methyltransferase domain-containing protein [Candidatus Omnitrophica bacterium]|nr:methyltransferase domain-containing protein [Candidatus Omnitrophota bacterium]